MNSPETLEIEIFSYEVAADDLLEHLRPCLAGHLPAATFHVKQPHSRFRSLEPSILVAVISGASAALGALIGGITRISQQTMRRTITIQSKSGAKIEFPADLSDDKVSQLVQQLKEMDAPRIYL